MILYYTVGSDRPILRDLLIHVIPLVADKWFHLGLILLDPKHEHHLKTIEADAKDAKTSCRKMFDTWLKTSMEACWDQVIKALRQLEANKVADTIRQQLQGECVYRHH